MPKKIFDFISSFGMMLTGVILLFVFSVSFSGTPKIIPLPKSGVRVCFGTVQTVSELPASKPIVPEAKDKTKFSGNLSAATALVVDNETNTTLFAYRPDEIRPLASITKLMSALVILDQKMDWSKNTVITDEDNVGGSRTVLVNEQYNAEELWHLALVGSINNAVTALVRLSGLSEEQFVQKMNEKAKELSFSTLRFVDSTGLNAGNVGNARDVAGLLDVALTQDKIKTALQKTEYKVVRTDKKKNKTIFSTDWLLAKWIPSDYKTNNIIGKTGYIADSGYNFVSKLTKDDGRAVRVVVLGANSNESRFTEARDLADWVFKHYEWPRKN